MLETTDDKITEMLEIIAIQAASIAEDKQERVLALLTALSGILELLED